MDDLEIRPEAVVTLQVRRASSSCCGTKLAVPQVPSEREWECAACGRPCERVLSDPVEVNG